MVENFGECEGASAGQKISSRVNRSVKKLYHQATCFRCGSECEGKSANENQVMLEQNFE